MAIKFLICQQKLLLLKTIGKNQVRVLKGKPEVIGKDELDIATTIFQLAIHFPKLDKMAETIPNGTCIHVSLSIGVPGMMTKIKCRCEWLVKKGPDK